MLAEVLPADEGLMRMGGESAAQFAEYHRSRRLADTVREALAPLDVDDRPNKVAAEAAEEFLTWLEARKTGRPRPDELTEAAEELADSWSFGNPISRLFFTCSPHRVALSIAHLRSYYQDEFAEQLIALLPD